MEEVWVECPCCGAKFPYPADDPVHTRDQIELFQETTNEGSMPEVQEEVR